MPHTGCRFLIVDAKASSVSFYERKGFSKIGQAADGNQVLRPMFMDMHRLSIAG